MTATSAEGATRTAFLSLDFVTYIVENFSRDDACGKRASVR